MCSNQHCRLIWCFHMQLAKINANKIVKNGSVYRPYPFIFKTQIKIVQKFLYPYNFFIARVFGFFLTVLKRGL